MINFFIKIFRLIFVLFLLATVIFAIYYFAIAPLIWARASILHMYDPDSLLVMKDGEIEHVQLIGVDAPEMAGPNRNITQCYHREANKQAAKLLRNNHDIILESDPFLTDKDQYGRLLRYIRLPDGRLLNEIIIEHGLAKEFHVDGEDYEKKEKFKTAERVAQKANIGIWTQCKGEF